MPENETQGRDQAFSGSGLIDHQKTLFGAVAQNAALMTEVQRSLFALAAACMANVMESTIATQREVARLSLDAVEHRDPLAMMSISQRAAQAGFREGLDCANRNLQAARTLGERVLESITTSAGMQAGSRTHRSKETRT